MWCGGRKIEKFLYSNYLVVFIHQRSAVTHTSPVDKTNITLVWTAPPYGTGTMQFRWDVVHMLASILLYRRVQLKQTWATPHQFYDNIHFELFGDGGGFKRLKRSLDSYSQVAVLSVAQFCYMVVFLSRFGIVEILQIYWGDQRTPAIYEQGTCIHNDMLLTCTLADRAPSPLHSPPIKKKFIYTSFAPEFFLFVCFLGVLSTALLLPLCSSERGSM